MNIFKSIKSLIEDITGEPLTTNRKQCEPIEPATINKFKLSKVEEDASGTYSTHKKDDTILFFSFAKNKTVRGSYVVSVETTDRKTANKIAQLMQDTCTGCFECDAWNNKYMINAYYEPKHMQQLQLIKLIEKIC